jgi:hypothetical protein
MTKKELIIPFLFIAFCFAFGVVSIAVFISNGRSKKWVARKMKIGGLLLSLTAVSCNGGRQVNCYDTEPWNYMYLNQTGEKGLEINIDTNNVLIGRISGRHGKDFSFSINAKGGNTLQKDFVLPLDSAFDKDSEDFKILIDPNIGSGTYELKLYSSLPQKQDTLQPQNTIKLIIKHE